MSITIIKKKKLSVFLSALMLMLSIKSYADVNSVDSVSFKDSGEYLPHLELSGAKFFNLDKSSWAAGIDMFLPLWQTNDRYHLTFTHARLFDRSSKFFEGNLHLGYRYLSEDKSRLHGVYGAFDRSRSYPETTSIS
jgi:hypothetical protein